MPRRMIPIVENEVEENLKPSSQCCFKEEYIYYLLIILIIILIFFNCFC